MKKIIAALTLSTLLFLNTACSSDDNTAVSQEELIIGKWLLLENGQIVDGKKTAETMDECEAKGFEEYTTDAKHIDTYFEAYPEGECNAHSRTSTYSLQDGTVTQYYVDPKFPSESEISNYKIITLTATELQLQIENESKVYYAIFRKI